MSSPIISAENLHKTYRMGRVDVPVLQGATLSIEPGEWVAILGASGSGKSTLLHLMGDLDRPDAGGRKMRLEDKRLTSQQWRRMNEGKCLQCGYILEGLSRCPECGAEQPEMRKSPGRITFQAVDINELSHVERNRYRNRMIGFVFQFYHLLPELNVLENTMIPSLVSASFRSWRNWFAILGIAIGLAILTAVGLFFLLAWIAGEYPPVSISVVTGFVAVMVAIYILPVLEVNALLFRLGPARRRLRARATELLNSFGLTHRLKHRPRELSGGERQRVAIARALMNDPKVLLADEPTGNLDEETGRGILDLIAAQHRRGLTIVMVTHDINVAARADRIVKLHHGRVET